MRRLAILLLATATLASAAPPAIAQQCTLCTAPPPPTSPAAESSHRTATNACALASRLHCPDLRDCWSTDLVRVLADSTTAIATQTPAYLMCRRSDCSGLPIWKSGILLPFAAVALIALTVQIGRLYLGGAPSLTPVIHTLFALAFAWAAITALSLGAATFLWQLVGTVFGFAASAGALISERATRLYGIDPDPCATGLTAAAGWSGVFPALDAYTHRLVELLGALAAIARTSLPYEDLFTLIRTVLSAFTIDLLPTILQVASALVIVATAVKAVLSFLLITGELLLSTALFVAILPITIFLAVWRATRAAFTNTILGIVTGATVLVTTGVVAAIAATLGGHLLAIFNQTILTGSPTELAAAGCPGVDPRAPATVTAQLDLYLAAYACNTDIPGAATHLFNTSFGWLPAHLVLIAGTITISVLFMSAAALTTELTGSRLNVGALSGAVTQQLRSSAGGIASRGASAAVSAGRRIGGFFR